MQNVGKYVSGGLVAIMALVLVPSASAVVGVTDGPHNLVVDPVLLPASSSPLALFEFDLGQDAGETLSSVEVSVTDNGGSGVMGADLASIQVYEDDGSGTFEQGSDTLLGTQATVELAPTTTVVTTGGAPLASGKFFVTLATGASWSSVAPADSVKVTLASDAIETSGGPLSYSAVMTEAITADTAGPVLDGAIAKNTGGSSDKEAGDSVELVFSESTNKPTIDSGNINETFKLISGHSWLSPDDTLGGSAWNTEGTVFTITLSASTTVVIGDKVVIGNKLIKDIAGNPAIGAQLIVGNFGGEQDIDEDEDFEHRGRCANDLINGRLYKVDDDATIYLAAACRLKPFRGAAVFHARGHKFQNIITLDSLPDEVNISRKPVLPAAGALIKGSDATVWFVTKKGKRKGFTSANVFHGLGFHFGQIKQISDQDLGVIPADSPINTDSEHPDGALIKCTRAATVFEVIGNDKFPFRSAEAFQSRGHSWDNIATVDCGRFRYIQGAPVDN